MGLSDAWVQGADAERYIFYSDVQIACISSGGSGGCCASFKDTNGGVPASDGFKLMQAFINGGCTGCGSILFSAIRQPPPGTLTIEEVANPNGEGFLGSNAYQVLPAQQDVGGEDLNPNGDTQSSRSSSTITSSRKQAPEGGIPLKSSVPLSELNIMTLGPADITSSTTMDSTSGITSSITDATGTTTSSFSDTTSSTTVPVPTSTDPSDLDKAIQAALDAKAAGQLQEPPALQDPPLQFPPPPAGPNYVQKVLDTVTAQPPVFPDAPTGCAITTTTTTSSGTTTSTGSGTTTGSGTSTNTGPTSSNTENSDPDDKGDEPGDGESAGDGGLDLGAAGAGAAGVAGAAGGGGLVDAAAVAAVAAAIAGAAAGATLLQQPTIPDPENACAIDAPVNATWDKPISDTRRILNDPDKTNLDFVHGERLPNITQFRELIDMAQQEVDKKNTLVSQALGLKAMEPVEYPTFTIAIFNCIMSTLSLQMQTRHKLCSWILCLLCSISGVKGLVIVSRGLRRIMLVVISSQV